MFVFDKMVIDDGILTANLDRKGRVTIPETVNVIGERAFMYSYDLFFVEMPSGLKKIERQAFSHCTSLTGATIPDGVTVIGSEAFNECKYLSSVNIPKSIQKVGSFAFANCKNLTDVYYPDVESIPQGCFHEDAFRWSPCIKNLHFPSMKSLLAFCTCLPICENIFVNGKLLAELDLTEGIERLPDKAFNMISCITKLKIGGSLKEVGYNSFKYLKKLTCLELVEGLTTLGAGSFTYNDTLGSVTIPNSLVSAKECFRDCKNLNDFYFPSMEKFIELCGFGYCKIQNLYVNGKLTKNIKVPSGVETIKSGTFVYLENVETITLANTVTTIEDYAISSCPKLKSLTIPSSVKQMGHISFEYLPTLTGIYFDNEEHMRFIYTELDFENKEIYVGGKLFTGKLKEEEEEVEEKIVYPTEYLTVVDKDYPDSPKVTEKVYYAKKPYTEEESKKIYEQAMQYTVAVHEDYDHEDMGSYTSNDSFSPPLYAILVRDGEFYGCLIHNTYYNFSQRNTSESYSEHDIILLPNGDRRCIYSSETSRSTTDQYARLVKK